jgi:hypothetical protein
MDPVTLVMAALLAGAATGASAAVSTAVTDAYQGLKELVLGRLRGGGVGVEHGHELIAAAADRPAGHAALTVELARVRVDELTVDAAQRLLDLLQVQKGKFVVDASQAKGLIVGDHGVQHNTFN